MISPIDNFATLSRLALDVAVFIAKKQRARFYTVLSTFITKYEELYPSKIPVAKPVIKQAPVTTTAQVSGTVVPQRSTEPVPDYNLEEENSIRCCICYEAK